MKKYIVPFALVSLVFALGWQLTGHQTKIVYNGITYADSDADTSATYTVGGAERVALRVRHTDSVSVVYKFDYRVLGQSAWTAVSAASADTVVETGSGDYNQIVLRDNLLERIPGLSTQFRVRAAYASSANSANSGAVHYGWLEYSN